MLPRIVFPLLMLAVVVGVHLYFYRRLVRELASSRRGRLLGGLLLVLATVLAGGGLAWQRLSAAPAATALSRAGYLVMAVMFYLLVALLAADALKLGARLATRLRRRGGGAGQPDAPADPARRDFLSRSVSLGAAACAVPATGVGAWRAFRPPEVNEVRVKLPNLPPALSGFTIAHLTDIHVGAWVDAEFVDQLVAATNACSPDLVAITGDLVDGSVERLGPAVSRLANLRSRHGTFFCIGNHEYYSGAEEWTRFLRGIGVQVLRNQRAVVGEPGASLDLVGVDDWSGRRQGFGSGWDLDAALSGWTSDRPTVLLAHQPRGFEEADRRGVGLQLSGHTHGGQMWPWTYLVKLAYHPYVAGLYQGARGAVYVSRGCGFWGPPVRLGVPPEIARIVLV